MESRNKELKEKYWSANTSVEEEKILKNQNNNEDLSDIEAKYFNYLKKESEVNPDIKFSYPAKRVKFPFRWAAASIAVLIAISGYLFQYSYDQNEFEVNDPELAYAITKNALFTISSGMNKGEVYTDKLVKFDDAKLKVRN